MNRGLQQLGIWDHNNQKERHNKNQELGLQQLRTRGKTTTKKIRTTTSMNKGTTGTFHHVSEKHEPSIQQILNMTNFVNTMAYHEQKQEISDNINLALC